MKRCIYCLSECPESAESCVVCGFNGISDREFKNCLPIGTRLNNRYVLGGVCSKEKAFVSYYAFDHQLKQRVKIFEYLHEKLMYRHPGEVIIKYYNDACLARADKEISAYYSHYSKLCEASKSSILNFTDCFAENSTCYFATSIDTGTPLSSLIGNGKALPVSKAMQLLKPVIDCAIRLEKIGKWHGSITPYSIITSDGKATSLTGYSYPPKSFYSPFDAPEKQLGAKKCGSFTDVYALGAIFYESTTGFLPPTAVQRNQGRILKFQPNFPEREKAVIEKALSLDKAERYQSVSEFYSALKGEKIPKAEKEKNSSEITRKILLAAAIICLIVSGAILINHYVIEPLKESKQASELAALVQTTVADIDIDPWEEIHQKHPDIDFPSGMNPSFSELYAINRDFSGWVSIPEMNINYSVVQTSNNEDYLRKDFYGNSTKYGVPFFDCRNSMTSLDRNTIIYGHNMRQDDKIFGTLEQYRTVDGFKKAPLIGMSTLYGDYTFKIYAVFISNSRPQDNNGDIFNYIFTNTTDEKFSKYIEEIDKRKLYSTGVDINTSDKILTLSTCCYDFTDARLVVVGRLLRSGESPAVDTSRAAENPSPKFPQAYYNAKRIDNPYANDPNVFNHQGE